jgi:beta-mannosidase
LVFDGLDTFAKVKLDDQTILESDNMFLAHRIDVTKLLEAGGEHTLEIDFDCALLRARELRKQHPEHKWVGFNGDPARMSVRKAQYHWGWDWGPVLMTAGIWKEVRLEVYSARVSDLWTEVDLAADHATAQVSAFAELETSGDASYQATFTLSLAGQEIAKQSSTPENNVAKVSFDVSNPSLWWPNGYGDQTLYEISVSLEKEETQVQQVSKKFGIRTAEVIQQPDKHGKSFFFRINGVDIFCGGACWIPADSLLTNVTPDRYRKWIELMAVGHQVMVRYVILPFHSGVC